MDEHETDGIARQLADMADMLNGKGAHENHTQTQAGRCVVCSCGLRAQGKLAK